MKALRSRGVRIVAGLGVLAAPMGNNFRWTVGGICSGGRRGLSKFCRYLRWLACGD